MKRLLLLTFLLGLFYCATAQVYHTTLTAPKGNPLENTIRFGSNVSPDGTTLSANSHTFLRNGEAWFPIMGEVHFVRLPQAEWEEAILKMKGAGIDIIATYVFWDYHEEEEGVFDWTGDRDLRAFIELCKENDVYLLLRIGPWCHGEVRYGGFPDYIQNIEGGTRRDNPNYLHYVERLYKEIGKQTAGLYWKEGGPIIGIQLENEFRFNSKSGLQHLQNLKRFAIEAGMDVPYYTATGWPAADIQQSDFIPVWGGYPEAPWNGSTKELALSANFTFGPLQNDSQIGNDILTNQESPSMDNYRFPYATAEMGGGNQITYHRRPIITSNDVTAMAYAKTGSGANLLGYYMFHGGSNKIGKKSTLQESKATRYANDYPIISYDFYSPLREYGQMNESYRNFKVLHLFLNEFGNQLATCYSNFPDSLCTKADDTKTLRTAVRSDGNSGFVFVNNYQRKLSLPTFPQVQFNLSLANGSNLTFPQEPCCITADEQQIMPFNMSLEGAVLRYTTAQPLTCLHNDLPTYLFFTHTHSSEWCFDKSSIKQLKLDGKKMKAGDTDFLFTLNEETHQIDIKDCNGKKFQIIVISHDDARNAWKVGNRGNEKLCISTAELIPDATGLRLRNYGDASFELLVFPKEEHFAIQRKEMLANASISTTNGWTTYRLAVPEQELTVNWEEETNPEKRVPQTLLPEDNRRDSVPADQPGPQYFVNFKPVEGSSYWDIKLPNYTGKFINNVFLQMDYMGDTGSLYQSGHLIADDYYAGLPFNYALNRLPKENDRSLLLQIIPYRNNLRVYWEPSVREQLPHETTARLKEVKLIPQYEIRLDY